MHAAGHALFRQGLLTAISNPKALLFYGAFLPQFIDPARDLLLQFVVMAVVFVVVECIVEMGCWRCWRTGSRPWLQRVGRSFNRACGGLFVAMGVALPLTR
jgi:homoserine/homoserine lactone efflux protein